MAAPLRVVDLLYETTPPEPLVTLVLPMRPKAKARPRFNMQSGHAHPTKADENWRKLSIAYARALLPYGLTLDEPLRLDLFAIYGRTKDQQKDKSLPDDFMIEASMGDRDNIAGAVQDALGSPTKKAKQGRCLWGDHGLWRDDSLVCCGEPVKLRAEKGGEAAVVLFVSRAWIPRLLLERLRAATSSR